MLNRNMPPGFGERVCSDGLQALIKNGKDLEIELAELKTKFSESESLHKTIKRNLTEADYRIACGEIVTYGVLDNKTPITDQLMHVFENGNVDMASAMIAIDQVRQLEIHRFEANKKYQISLNQYKKHHKEVVRHWFRRCSESEALVEKLQDCANCNHGVSYGYEPGYYCSIDKEMLCRARSGNPLQKSYWEDEPDNQSVERKPVKTESQTPMCEAWLEDNKLNTNDLFKLAIWLEAFKNDSEEIILDLIKECDEARNDVQIITGKLKTEREYSNRLEIAISGALQSADAEWEEKNMGHDWRQACLNMRNALLNKDAGEANG
jgi:hypothetical protein